ncbi:sugar phosphate isomerase/epimerase family protein [Dysosmobacter sp.]|uniref:sugar phosphate isomerase/epimerase family protein n=1 Tax=Dysosmobacter sp. TaxID=2591382 RepID=UPI003AB18186
MNISLGGFGYIRNLNDILSNGFNYAELDMPEIEQLSENDFFALRDGCLEQKLSVYVGVRVLPVIVPIIFSGKFSVSAWRPYLEKTFRRASQLGIKKCVFGNGKARSLSDGNNIESRENFILLMRMMSEISGENGMELLLEPLGPKYSNFINTLPQAFEYAERVNLDNFNIMADIRHMVGSNDPFSNLINCAGRLHHVHLDYPLSYPKRPFPTLVDDYDYTGFFHNLIASGYEDTLTVEADLPQDWGTALKETLKLLNAHGIYAGGNPNLNLQSKSKH